MASKLLSKVDVARQHEINVIKEMKTILGETGTKDHPNAIKPCHVVYESANGKIEWDGNLVYYDSRIHKTGRGPEYRLYFPNDCTPYNQFCEGDKFSISYDNSGKLQAYCCPATFIGTVVTDASLSNNNAATLAFSVATSQEGVVMQTNISDEMDVVNDLDTGNEMDNLNADDALLIGQINGVINNNNYNDKEIVLKEIVTTVKRNTQQQKRFRQLLLDEYKNCVISGFGIGYVLEAAHIKPFATDGDYDISNGLLLRADFHCIMDSGKLKFELSNPETNEFTIFLADDLLQDDYYKQFHLKKILLPKVNRESLKLLADSFKK